MITIADPRDHDEAIEAIRMGGIRSLQLVALGLAVAGILILGAMKIAQSRYKDAKEAKKSSPDDIRGPLHVIHAAVAARKRVADPPDAWLRITFYRVDHARQELEQSVNYVGSEEPPERQAGRKFTINAGLIGRAARVNDVRGFDRPAGMSFEEWAKYLVDEAGMTQAAADATRKDRFSFLAVPITTLAGQEVRAVVYLDAGTPQFFDKETQEVVMRCCEGLAAWIDEHYYR